MAQNDAVGQLAALIMDSRDTVVFTGAGVSTESGLPDFRSPGGIWEEFDPREMTYQKFINSRTHRQKYWRFYLQLWEEFGSAEPNSAHESIARLQRLGHVSVVITQNVDGLHQRAGSPGDRVLRIHGHMWSVHCIDCRHTYDHRYARDQLKQSGTAVPLCGSCGGILKPCTIAFGEQLPEDVFAQAQKHCTTCDLIISVGSSLTVYPAALLPQLAQSTGAKHAIINRDPTEMDPTADLVIHGLAGEVLKCLLQQVNRCESDSNSQ